MGLLDLVMEVEEVSDRVSGSSIAMEDDSLSVSVCVMCCYGVFV